MRIYIYTHIYLAPCTHIFTQNSLELTLILLYMDKREDKKAQHCTRMVAICLELTALVADNGNFITAKVVHLWRL